MRTNILKWCLEKEAVWSMGWGGGGVGASAPRCLEFLGEMRNTQAGLETWLVGREEAAGVEDGAGAGTLTASAPAPQHARLSS